jgi:hypothetical protein
MPLCPQVTITPITVTSTGMTQTSVIAAGDPATTEQLTTVSDSVAAATAAAAAATAAAALAQTDADAAQAAAAAAQAEADDAYNTAVAANTAASTAQTTANGKNKVTYSTSAPGSTANAVGDVWFQYGTTSPNVGRIIAQYIGAGGTSWTQTTVSGLVIANIDAGSITTGTLTVGLGITTGTGTFTVNAVTGALFADSATIKGQVNALSGYFGTDTNGYSITSTGLVGVGSGVIIGGQIQTSSGATSVSLIGSTNSLSFKNGGVFVGHIVPLGSGGILMHYGSAPDGSGGTFPQMFVGSGNVSMSVRRPSIGINTISVSEDLISFSGDAYARNRFYVEDTSIATTAPNGRIDSDGRVRRTTGSSARFKENIVDLGTVGDMAPQQLLTLPVRAFTFKPDYLDAADNRVGVPVPGFIAEEVSEHYPAAADYDANGNPENWNERFLIPGMLALIQDLYKEIELLKGE